MLSHFAFVIYKLATITKQFFQIWRWSQSFLYHISDCSSLVLKVRYGSHEVYLWLFSGIWIDGAWWGDSNRGCRHWLRNIYGWKVEQLHLLGQFPHWKYSANCKWTVRISYCDFLISFLFWTEYRLDTCVGMEIDDLVIHDRFKCLLKHFPSLLW